MRALLRVLVFVVALGSAGSGVGSAGTAPGLILRAAHLQGKGMPSSVTWTDLAGGRARTVAYDGDGHVSSQHAETLLSPRVRQGSVDYLSLNESVDYKTKLWRSKTVTLSLPRGTRLASRSIGDDDSFPAQIRRRLSQGRLQVVARQRHRSKTVLHMRGNYGPLIAIDLWVDVATYQAAREVQTTMQGGTPSHTTILFTWLPRTRANEAKTRIVVPRGFTHQNCTERLPTPGGSGWGTGVLVPKCSP